MSLMSDPKQSVLETIGEMQALLREQVEAAEAFARRGRDILNRAAGERPTTQAESTMSGEYVDMDAETACKRFLTKRGKPATETEIVEALKGEGVITGSKKLDTEGVAENIARSLKANSDSNKSKKKPTFTRIIVGKHKRDTKNDIYGLPEWQANKESE